jgi:RNA polymerase sigma-70 factor (ECF subfamily)
VDAHDTHGAIRAVFRLEWARLVASLVRVVHDVARAEELAQDAIVIALEQWPASGIPDNPGAWLQAVARNRALNVARRSALVARKHDAIGVLEAARERQMPAVEAEIDDDVGDDMLRLVLIACDPVLPVESRVALTLRLLGGLTTDEIARAFLVPEPTIAQRIVRAKRTLAEAAAPFEVPRGEDLASRLSSVFGVIYLIYNEGYSATEGQDLIRPQLCDDALRLGRMLAELVPAEPEAHGLVALMELQASRTAARVDAGGEPVLLLGQDRSRWDRLLIGRGLAALARAQGLGDGRGPYTLQAAIAACHARASTASETDWSRIADLYGELALVAPSPVVRLNRAMAVAMATGPAAGLELVEALGAEPALQRYHLLPSARADLLFKLGRHAEARAEFERAASLTENARQRARLLERARACEGDSVRPTSS